MQYLTTEMSKTKALLGTFFAIPKEKKNKIYATIIVIKILFDTTFKNLDNCHTQKKRDKTVKLRQHSCYQKVNMEAKNAI